MKKNNILKIIAIIATAIMALVGITYSFEIFGIKIPETVALVLEILSITTLFILGIIKWIKPSQEHTKFKIIILIIMYLALLSWVVPATTSQSGELMNLGVARVSLYQLLYYPLLAIQFFLQPLLFMLSVGGLYGILAKTGKYRNKLEKIAKSMKGKEEIFLISTSLILALLSSVFGLTLLLFAIIPILCGIIIIMGYDKITAFLTTFMAPLIGVIGSTYGFYVNGYINQITGTDFKTEIIFKIALFVISYIVYIYFTINHARKIKSKPKMESEQIDENEIPFLGEKTQSKKPSWPIFVVLSILLVLTIFGCTVWSDVFGTTFFTDLHEAITEWSIKDYTILSYLITDLENLGKWYFTEMTVFVLLSSIIIKSVYKVEDATTAFIDGVKKVLKPALLVVIAYTVVIITAYHPYFVTITDWMINLTSNFKGVIKDLLFILLAGINTILSTILNIDMLYVVQSSGQYINTDATNVLAIITQSLYGITLFLAPTSTMLLLGLEYLKIPYKKWLKTSWKLVLQLLAISLIIILIVAFI